MNILILTTHLNPGGISRYVVNLAKGLNRQGCKVWVASCGGQWLGQLNDLGISHRVIPINTKSICSIKILLSFIKLRNFIIEEKIKIIHSNTRVTQALGWLIYKKLSVPYINTYHGFYRSTLSRKLFKFAGLRSIAVSEAVKKRLVKCSWFNPDKIRVVYNGLDAADFFITESKKSEYGFREQDFLIGILGRISKEEGHFLAAKAMQILSSKYDNVYLLFSGKGKLEKQLRSFIVKAKIEAKVKFLDCPANNFLDIINLLLVPSQKEGFGYSVIEAFLKEVPVIGYNVGGIAEIIKNRKNGILFYNYNTNSLIDAIEELMLKENLRKKITTGAKEDIWYFSYERMTLDTEKVYKEVLE